MPPLPFASKAKKRSVNSLALIPTFILEMKSVNSSPRCCFGRGFAARRTRLRCEELVKSMDFRGFQAFRALKPWKQGSSMANSPSPSRSNLRKSFGRSSRSQNAKHGPRCTYIWCLHHLEEKHTVCRRLSKIHTIQPIYHIRIIVDLMNKSYDVHVYITHIHIYTYTYLYKHIYISIYINT